MATQLLPNRMLQESNRVEPRAYAASIGLGVLLAIAYLPLLVLQVHGLWHRPHYQFLPFVLLGSAYLACRDTRDLGPLEPGSRAFSTWLIGLSWAVLAVAVLFLSPWLGAMATLAALPAFAYAWGGSRLVRRLLPAWGLLWICQPLPGSLDHQLIEWLQTVATRWSSSVFDVLGVIHVRSGNVIEVPDKPLLVEEACSGAHSLFVVLAGTLFLALLVRCSWARGITLFVTAIVWVLLGNVARIVAVVWSHTAWNIDLLKPPAHDILGFVVTAAILGLVASTDTVYRVVVGFLLGQWRASAAARNRRRAKRLRASSNASRIQTTPSATPVPKFSASELAPTVRTRLTAVHHTALVRWPVLVAFAALAIGQVAWVWPAIKVTFADRTPLLQRLLTQLNAETLPPKWGSLVRTNYEVQHRAGGSDWGEFSRVWSYRLGSIPVVASVDFTFPGWHELTLCYKKAGWTLTHRESRDGEQGSLVTAELTMPTNRYAFLAFRLFANREQCAVQPPDLNRASDLTIVRFTRQITDWQRLSWRQYRQKYLLPPGFTDQLQVFVESPRPLTEAERKQICSFLDVVTESVHARRAEGGRLTP